MENTGNQQPLGNENYAEYMARLYKPKPIDYSAQLRNSNGDFVSAGNKDQRKMWSFRVPNELAEVGYDFMKKHGMSITTYLTFAMHNLHQPNDNG